MASEFPSDPPPPNPSLPKAFSLSLGASKPKPPPLSRKPLTPSSALKDGTKRRHVSTLSDSEEEDSTGTAGEPLLVSTFDHSAGGAIGVVEGGEERGPLVIPSQKNRDWREESKRKRGKNLLPPEVRQAIVEGAEGDVVNGGVQAYGLTFVERATTKKDGVVDVEMVTEQTLQAEQAIQPQAKTDDELALEALTSQHSTGRNSSLVLPASGVQRDALDNHQIRNHHISEDDAYRLDVASRPDPASLDDYAAVPVEEFGAALLRGMGWKEGDVVGKRKDQVSKPRVVERRPALLGIGAKEVPGGLGEELGAWGKGIKKRSRATDKTYNPVVLKNSKTGEMLTEEELKAKKEEYEKAEKDLEEDWRDRRDRNLGRDLERKEGRNEGRANSRYAISRHFKPSISTSNLHRTHDRSGDRDHHHHHRRGRDHQESSGSRDRSAHRERSRSSDSRHRRRRDGVDKGGVVDSRDWRWRDGGGSDDRRERDNRKYRRRRDGEDGDWRDKNGSESESSRRGHRERGEYNEEKTRRRQEVF